MIRERQLNTWTYAAGTTQVLDLPRDAAYHILTIAGQGTVTDATVTTGTGVVFDTCFPFSIFRNIRLIRNGSDVVFQGSGCLAAKEHYYLNEHFPHARLYQVTTNVETLLLSSAAGAFGGKGLTVPANSAGIGMTQTRFAATSTATGTQTILFDFQFDIFLQLGAVEDLYYSTLIDARKLATYQLELQYAAVADFSVAGAGATVTVSGTSGRVLSYDQDNLPTDKNFGTFKRSQLSYSNLAYSSTNNQVLLPRGNYFAGMIIETLAAKAFSTTVLVHENAIVDAINNRINSNFSLRQVEYEDLQRKNQADGCEGSAWSGSRGQPNGSAYMWYPSTGDRASELVPTHVMDQFDLQLSLQALASAENGVTTAATLPTINFLLEEVIPGVNMGAGNPRGAQAGSIVGTSAKPYAR